MYRVLVRGKDERFDQMRERCLAFLGFWIFQMVWVWVVSLPVTFLNSASVNVGVLTWMDVVGGLLWLLGFILETIADHTKAAWYSNPATRDLHLRSGVWSVSRHPNYCGEIMCWIGIFLISTAVYSANTEYAFFSVFSPIITIVLLLFVSGVPLAEARADQKFGKDPEYQEYKRTTSPVIPMPTCVYAAMSCDRGSNYGAM